MNIVSRSEVKTLLKISDTSQDTYIDALIPGIEDYITDFLSNYFVVPGVRVIGSTLALVAGSPATITDSGNGFLDAGFADGVVIRVSGSWFNDGYYLVNTVEAGTLTLASSETLVNETPDTTQPITVVLAKIPSAVKVAAAQMIGHKIDNRDGIASEKVGNYSVTYSGDVSKSGYPDRIINAIRPFKRVHF